MAEGRNPDTGPAEASRRWRSSLLEPCPPHTVPRWTLWHGPPDDRGGSYADNMIIGASMLINMQDPEAIAPADLGTATTIAATQRIGGTWMERGQTWSECRWEGMWLGQRHRHAQPPPSAHKVSEAYVIVALRVEYVETATVAPAVARVAPA